MAYNAADEKQVSKKEEENKLAREQELKDLSDLLDTGAGMRFFKRFMDEGMIFHTSFTGNSKTFFYEGQRSLALKFFKDICEASPQHVAELMVRTEEKKEEE